MAHDPGTTDGTWRSLVSADAHVNEPRDLWSANLPAALRQRAMRGIAAGEDGTWGVLFDATSIDMTTRHESDRMRASDPGYRLEVMRAEGIAAEAVFPTVGLYVWGLDDPVGGAASCRVYNEWIADRFAGLDRFACAGIVPAWQVADAIAEVEWIASHGLRAVMLPTVAAPDWNHPQWVPLWDAVAATGLPVVMHQGTGHSMYFYRGPGAGVSNLLATQSMGPRTAALLATSGVLAAHPDLHVVFVEYNAGWLAWTMQTLDFYTDAFGRYGTMPSGKPWVHPALPEPPSAYLRRQVHATFQDDPVAIHNVALTGADALLWGNDYPHEEGTYPRSQEVVARLAGGLAADDARKVFASNAAAVFGFPASLLQPAR